jgi:negative regulator of flagellin synthesis FlgM
MSDIPPIQAAGSAPALALSEREPVASSSTATLEAAPLDSVEISDMAAALSVLDAPETIRIDKVSAIRDAILNGTYETPDKIEATVERLLGVLEES